MSPAEANDLASSSWAATSVGSSERIAWANSRTAASLPTLRANSRAFRCSVSAWGWLVTIARYRCQCRLRLSLRGLQFGDPPESVEVVGLRREHGPACGESGVGAVEADGQ